MPWKMATVLFASCVNIQQRCVCVGGGGVWNMALLIINITIRKHKLQISRMALRFSPLVWCGCSVLHFCCCPLITSLHTFLSLLWSPQTITGTPSFWSCPSFWLCCGHFKCLSWLFTVFLWYVVFLAVKSTVCKSSCPIFVCNSFLFSVCLCESQHFGAETKIPVEHVCTKLWSKRINLMP